MSELKLVSSDGMRIAWDVPILMSDGVTLRADIFLPEKEGKYPVLMGQSPYGKGVQFQDPKGSYAFFWKMLTDMKPEVLAGNTNKYQAWEQCNPERWTKHEYAVMRIDSRGSGRSEGILDVYSARETRDYYECIEWAAAQDFCTGKVGLLGISYLAINQWQVAAMRPPHLAAICPVEGCCDFYREWAYHGGIRHSFTRRWYPEQVTNLQHGVGERYQVVNPNTGELVSGPETLSDDELKENHNDLATNMNAHTLCDGYYKELNADLSKIEVPLLSSGNWGGQHLHLRGNIEGYLNAGSKQKWLELHGLQHFTEFYTDYGENMQRRFFDHFLKGLDTWSDQPPVKLRLRKVDGSFVDRGENEWPLARTQWTKFYLNPAKGTLTKDIPEDVQECSFKATEGGIDCYSEPLTEEMEITGPAMTKLFISSSTSDADIFVTLRVLDPEGKDVTFIGTTDPHTVVASGFLRASHRALDEKKTLPYRPYHKHTSVDPLVPGEVYDLDVEIIPTSVIIPAGYRFGISIRGRDFELPGDGPWPVGLGVTFRGNASHVHDDPDDRDRPEMQGVTTLHNQPEKHPYLMLPVIPG